MGGGALNDLYCVNMKVITKASISKPRQKNRTRSTFTEMSAVQRTPLPTCFFSVRPIWSLLFLLTLALLIWHSQTDKAQMPHAVTPGQAMKCLFAYVTRECQNHYKQGTVSEIYSAVESMPQAIRHVMTWWFSLLLKLDAFYMRQRIPIIPRVSFMHPGLKYLWCENIQIKFGFDLVVFFCGHWKKLTCFVKLRGTTTTTPPPFSVALSRWMSSVALKQTTPPLFPLLAATFFSSLSHPHFSHKRITFQYQFFFSFA